jgi:hypothetical protein
MCGLIVYISSLFPHYRTQCAITDVIFHRYSDGVFVRCRMKCSNILGHARRFDCYCQRGMAVFRTAGIFITVPPRPSKQVFFCGRNDLKNVHMIFEC